MNDNTATNLPDLLKAETAEARRINLTRDEEISFWFEYMMAAARGPWSDSALEQHEAGDDTLLNGIKRKAMKEGCAKFGISVESGNLIISQFFHGL